MDAQDYKLWQRDLGVLLGRFAELSAAQRGQAKRVILFHCNAVVGGIRSDELSASDGAVIKPDAQDDWLLAGMLTALRKRGLTGKVAEILGSASGKKYASAAATIRVGLEDVLGEHRRDHAAQLVLARFVVCGLYRRFERLGISPTPRMILGSVAFAFEAIDICFPGYIAASILPMVISEWLRNNRGDPQDARDTAAARL